LTSNTWQKILPGRPSSEFRTLLWSFTATAWKCANTSPRTLGTRELAVASFFTREFCDQKQYDCHPPPTLIFSVSPNEDKTERPLFGLNWGDRAESQAMLYSLTEHARLPGCTEKIAEALGTCVHADGHYFEFDMGGQ
jgi:hypothetical protein